MTKDVKKIVEDHQKKSNQLKTLRRKLKYKTQHTISVEKLKKMLAIEMSEKIDHRDYYSWGEYNESGYMMDVGAKEARINLLKELISSAERKLS